MSPTAYRVGIGVAFAALTAAIAALLHSNPFGTGTIDWFAAIAIAALGNALLMALALRIGPYLVSPAHKHDAPDAQPRRERAATLASAATLMTASLICLAGVSAVSSDPIIVPTERLEHNAKLARATIETKAPREFQSTIPGADTWRVSKDVFRTCVLARNSDDRAWCVTIEATDTSTKVLRYGPGKTNARVFLESKEGGAEPVE